MEFGEYKLTIFIRQLIHKYITLYYRWLQILDNLFLSEKVTRLIWTNIWRGKFGRYCFDIKIDLEFEQQKHQQFLYRILNGKRTIYLNEARFYPTQMIYFISTYFEFRLVDDIFRRYDLSDCVVNSEHVQT